MCPGKRRQDRTSFNDFVLTEGVTWRLILFHMPCYDTCTVAKKSRNEVSNRASLEHCILLMSELGSVHDKQAVVAM